MVAWKAVILKIINDEGTIYLNQIASKSKLITNAKDNNRFCHSVINKLEIEKLIICHEGRLESTGGRPSTKYYTITPKGSEYLKSQIEELSKTLKFLEDDKIQYYGCNNCRIWK